MKKAALMIVLAMVLWMGGCAAQADADTKLMPSSTDYSVELDINTPEGLAQESSSVYQQMISEGITIEEGYERLLAISCAESANSLAAAWQEFKDQVSGTIAYFNNQEDAIDRFEFAETVYADDNTASIKRIQHQKNGKTYCFEQDFIKEEGAWKIKGDNIIDKFELKQKFLFWYI